MKSEKLRSRAAEGVLGDRALVSVAPGSKSVDSHDETGTKTGPKNVLPGSKCRISQQRAPNILIKAMVGLTGFEPATPTSRRCLLAVQIRVPICSFKSVGLGAVG